MEIKSNNLLKPDEQEFFKIFEDNNASSSLLAQAVIGASQKTEANKDTETELELCKALITYSDGSKLVEEENKIRLGRVLLILSTKSAEEIETALTAVNNVIYEDFLQNFKEYDAEAKERIKSSLLIRLQTVMNKWFAIAEMVSR